ncbi:hypothetical protein ACHWQZ_G016180 [Mnemiopsis leidyi]
MKKSTLQFVPFKSDRLGPGSARAIVASAIDEEEVQKEAHEVLTTISASSSKRKRSLPPSCSSSESPMFSEDFVACMKDILKQSYEDIKSPKLGQKALGCPDQFALMVTSCDPHSFNMHEFFSFIKYKPLTSNLMKNIELLLNHRWITLTDIADKLDTEKLNEMCTHLACEGHNSHNVIEFLASKPQYRSILTQICVFSISKPPGINLKTICHIVPLSVNDVISSLLRKRDSVSLEETYANIVNVLKEQLFQDQVCKFQDLFGDLPVSQTLTTLSTTTNVSDVNPRFFIVIWSIIVRMEVDSVIKFDFLSDFLKSSINTKNRHNFKLAIIMMRILDLLGSRPYTENYQLFFGNTSTIISSSKSVEFILDNFTSLVPHEVGMYLKHHIQLPLRGGAKFKEKLDQYLILAKTRMKDFNLIEIDKNVVHDIEKAIVAFKKKRAVPSSIIEASIFKKQYYINHFLPCLLKENCVEDEKGRQDLIDKLKSANKIPQSVLHKPSDQDVMEIAPVENLKELIASLPSRGIDIKNTIYSLCCSSCDKGVMLLLIETVCLKCQNIDSVDFLRDFVVTQHLREMFKDCVHQLCLKGVTSMFDLLTLLDSHACDSILKSVLFQSFKLYKSIPVSLEIEYLHFIVLGKLIEDIETPIPNAAWKQLSTERLCETLSWWPYDRQNLCSFQAVVSLIFHNLISNQACNDVCLSLFKSCLIAETLSLVSSIFTTLLPLTSFSKLWVYEALAQVLLPLYQTSSEKPVSKIKEVFRNFFNVVNVIKPSLLCRSGGVKSVENLLSVLDSYKIYITTERFILSYPVTATILRSLQDAALLNVIIEKSPTFLISCVCYIDELSKGRGAEVLKNNDHFKVIISFLQKLEVGGVSSNDYPDQRYCSQIGVAWFLLFAEKHLTEFSAVSFQNTIMEGYLTAMFYSYANNWLSGTLTESHVASLGELAVKCGQYHDSYTRPLLESAAAASGAGGVLTQHFSGYKNNKVFCLLYLGGVAHCYNKRYQIRDTILPLAKKSYSQSQRLVYDNLQTMSSMQKFMMSITRGSQDTATTARNFIISLTSGIGNFSGA